MRFEEAYDGWQSNRLTQEEAAGLLGVCDRTFRRYVDGYEEEGLEGLIDKRLEQVSHRKAPGQMKWFGWWIVTGTDTWVGTSSTFMSGIGGIAEVAVTVG
ncbi:MAG: helix-turn-helix domain-containing protein [Burkholderiales bacterium]